MSHTVLGAGRGFDLFLLSPPFSSPGCGGGVSVRSSDTPSAPISCDFVKTPWEPDIQAGSGSFLPPQFCGRRCESRICQSLGPRLCLLCSHGPPGGHHVAGRRGETTVCRTVCPARRDIPSPTQILTGSPPPNPPREPRSLGAGSSGSLKGRGSELGGEGRAV